MPLQSYWSRYRCFQKWRNLTEEKWKLIKRHNYGFTDLVRFLNPTDTAFKLCVIILNCRFYCLLLSFIETGRNLKYIVSSLFHCQLGTINVISQGMILNWVPPLLNPPLNYDSSQPSQHVSVWLTSYGIIPPGQVKPVDPNPFLSKELLGRVSQISVSVSSESSLFWCMSITKGSNWKILEINL